VKKQASTRQNREGRPIGDGVASEFSAEEIAEAINFLRAIRKSPDKFAEYNPFGEEGKTLAALKHIGKHKDAVFSAKKIPYNDAVKQITGENRKDRANQKFDWFVKTIIPNLGDSIIPWHQLFQTQNDSLPAFSEEWRKTTSIPEPWVDQLKNWFETFWTYRLRCEYRAKGKKTALKKKTAS
jgi:hypothetical protein